MVNGNSATLTMRLVRSKWHKREEASPTMECVPENIQDSKTKTSISFENAQSNKADSIERNNTKDGQVNFIRTSGGGGGHSQVANGHECEWSFPPKAPTPHIYHCLNPELLVASRDNGLKGFRKQFSGRFKRLVVRKPDPVPVIPPELKPQLKTIYVY